MKKHKSTLVKILAAMSLFVVLLIVGAGVSCSLSAGNDNTNDNTYEQLKVFSSVIDLLEKNYVDPVDPKKLIDAAIKGMVESLDPHCQYLPPDAFEELQTDTQGEFEGIGIVITMSRGMLTVISPIEGTPAYKAGIQPGDIITKIDNEPTTDMELWEAVKKMRGKKGTKVTITIHREGVKEEISFDLVRAVIPILSVKSALLKPGYGYIWITNFQANTTDDFKKALEKLESTDNGSLNGLILDLRNNPGGLLDQAVSISDVFLDKGIILKVKERENEKVYNAHPIRKRHNYPIVLLINGGTASASEIVAGALKDHKRALIMGTTSFGKGSVQTVQPLNGGSGIKYTIARYYTPNGTSIQAKGIVPDIEVQYKVIEDTEKKESAFIKEKDLKHHLLAEPEAEKQKDEKSPPPKPEEKDTDLTNTKYGELDVDMLLHDSQIARALDALVSYRILGSMDDGRYDNK